MANLIRVVGVGPGSPEYITPEAVNLINSADVLVGGERLLKQFGAPDKEIFFIKNNLPEMVEYIKSRRHTNIAVLASGDPAFYGILEFLKKNFNETELLVSPGLSSVQVACARLRISWHDAAFYSVHGRDMDGLLELVKSHRKVIVLTDPANTPAVIAARLIAAGILDRKIRVCENLSYGDERIGEFDLNRVPADIGKSGCIVVIYNE